MRISRRIRGMLQKAGLANEVLLSRKKVKVKIPHKINTKSREERHVKERNPDIEESDHVLLRLVWQQQWCEV